MLRSTRIPSHDSHAFLLKYLPLTNGQSNRNRNRNFFPPRNGGRKDSSGKKIRSRSIIRRTNWRNDFDTSANKLLESTHLARRGLILEFSSSILLGARTRHWMLVKQTEETITLTIPRQTIARIPIRSSIAWNFRFLFFSWGVATRRSRFHSLAAPLPPFPSHVWRPRPRKRRKKGVEEKEGERERGEALSSLVCARCQYYTTNTLK